MPSTSVDNLKLVALKAVDRELLFMEAISIFFDAWKLRWEVEIVPLGVPEFVDNKIRVVKTIIKNGKL